MKYKISDWIKICSPFVLIFLVSPISNANNSNGINKDSVVGVQPITLTVTEQAIIPTGLSIKKSLLNKYVYNDAGEKVGKVDDLIVSLDKQVTFAILGAGGFLGIDRHDVAVPVRFLSVDDNGKILFPSGTKKALMEMPRFRYAK